MERFLKSRYRIGDRIGESPFSYTYKGYLMGTEVPVVIKIYKRSALNSPLINKLRPKVTKIISLDHPNIARVIDGDYGWQGFYFVREYIEGEDLESYMAKGLPDLTIAVEVIKQVLSALSLAHAENLIHGAISARNIFLAGKEVKVTDFILEPAVRINPTLLAAAATLNSSFMSPEQIIGEPITPASDIYSVGIVFYLLVTGRLPLDGKSGLDTALRHLSDEMVPPSQLNSSVPDYIDEIIMKMLEKDPLQRISKANDVIESLDKQRLIFNPPNREFVNLIYGEDVEPIEYKEEIAAPKKKPPVKKGRKMKINKTVLMILVLLIAIASGLWYAFILNFISSGGK
jgi:eukaryotic-like serine/threonine-protein kinase